VSDEANAERSCRAGGGVPRASALTRALLAADIERVLQRRSPITRDTRRQTERWLAWLAWQMTRHPQTLWSLERLQPPWLPDRVRWMSRKGGRLSSGLVGGLIVGLVLGGTRRGQS
jgi:hypothetical protein